MTVRIETTGNIIVCDGCGRSDAGPDQQLYVDAYFDGDAAVHYCAACALTRLSSGQIQTDLKPPATR